MGTRGGTDPNTAGRSLPESMMGRAEEQVLNIGGFEIWWPWMWGFPGGSDGKESTCSEGDLGSTPESGRPSGEGSGYTPQHSGLENPMDRGAWQAIVHGVAVPAVQAEGLWMSEFTSPSYGLLISEMGTIISVSSGYCGDLME